MKMKSSKEMIQGKNKMTTAITVENFAMYDKHLIEVAKGFARNTLIEFEELYNEARMLYFKAVKALKETNEKFNPKSYLNFFLRNGLVNFIKTHRKTVLADDFENTDINRNPHDSSSPAELCEFKMDIVEGRALSSNANQVVQAILKEKVQVKDISLCQIKKGLRSYLKEELNWSYRTVKETFSELNNILN